MNIHAISYTNIWPFTGEPRTVRFSVWNHLVKAPIGSGKSFLFFDGPLFALYKRSKRPMLNRQAERGSVVMIRSDYGRTFAIEREIKATKLGNDSVTSRLYDLSWRFWWENVGWSEWWGFEWTEDIGALDAQLSAFLPSGLSVGTDISSRVRTYWEEIVFSSQTELDQHVQSILPPKEVMLNLHFLMQDHENIFDVGPAERITVFKHLFGLLGIDEGKERLTEKKKEVQLMLKVKSDTEQFDMKLRKFLKELLAITERLTHIERPEVLASEQQRIQEIVQTQDLNWIVEQVHIDKFEREAKEHEGMQSILEQVVIKRDQLLAGYEQRKLLASQYAEAGAEHERLQKQYAERNLEIASLEKTLSEQAPQDETKLYEKKELLAKQQHELIEPSEQTYLSEQGMSISSFVEYYHRLKGMLARGKELKAEQEMGQERIVQMTRHVEESQKKRQQLQEQLQKFEQEYAGQLVFHCDKIAWTCPYVEVIKGAALLSLRQQKEFLQQQIEQLDKEIKVQEEDVARMQWVKYENEELAQIKQHVQSLSWKTLDDRYVQYQDYERQQKQLDQELMRHAQERRQRELLQETYTQKKAQQTTTQDQIQTAAKNMALYSERLQELAVQWLQKWEVTIYDSIAESINAFVHTSVAIQWIVYEYTQIKYEVKQLQETEKMLSDLTTIFSKELLLLVLQDFLPSLQEVMNSYLAQLVEYTVHFELQKSTSDKLELEISVNDTHGKRPIKSLSGGQRTILKLIWILSVASMMQTKFLFLDETINNLDVDAIAKVAELLDNYMHARQIKLYLVTHAPQIQEMQLRDSIVAL